MPKEWFCLISDYICWFTVFKYWNNCATIIRTWKNYWFTVFYLGLFDDFVIFTADLCVSLDFFVNWTFFYICELFSTVISSCLDVNLLLWSQIQLIGRRTCLRITVRPPLSFIYSFVKNAQECAGIAPYVAGMGHITAGIDIPQVEAWYRPLTRFYGCITAGMRRDRSAYRRDGSYYRRNRYAASLSWSQSLN